MPKKRAIALLFSLLLVIGAWPASSTQAASATAALTPSSQSINVGQVTTVALQVQNVDNLFGYQVAIIFDPSLLEVIDADATKPGVQVALGTFLKADFVQQNGADNIVGAIVCVVSQLAPSPAVTGSGTLLTITFRGKAQGVSNVRFTDLRLARSDGTEITTTRTDAQIAVGTTVPPTPTTIVPTATATVIAPTPTGTVVAPTPTATTGTPQPTPTPTATLVPGQQVIYVVQSGDTLYSIARRFGVSVQALIQINNITRPSFIRTGQRLIIPRGTAVTPTPSANPTIYVVQHGDTLYSIARRFGTTVQALALLNHIANPSLIFAGQRLIISGSGTPVPPPARVHIVQPGETLYSLARRYGTTVWAIVVANHLASANVIYVGQSLVIP